MPPVFVLVAVVGAGVFVGRGFPAIGAGVFVAVLGAVFLTEAEGGVKLFTVAGGGVGVTRGAGVVILAAGETTGGTFRTAGAGGVLTGGAAIRGAGVIGGGVVLVNGTAGVLTGGLPPVAAE